MPRWMPRAKERLRDAAVELSVARGYDSVTVAEITEYAGLTRRTFSRYFTDKRDVFFAGSEQLAAAAGAAVADADADLGHWDAVVTALREVGQQLVQLVPTAAQRRIVVRASPELQERERTKFALVAAEIAAALEKRGAPASLAGVLGEVGATVFRAAFDRWLDDPEKVDFATRFDAALAELASCLGS